MEEKTGQHSEKHALQERTIVRYSQEGKKHDAEHLDLSQDIIEIPDYSPAETKRILRKVDIRLLPMLAFFYLLAYLDRGNVGNAKLFGMAKDLKLTDQQYNLCLTLFFIPYALLEVPSNIVLKKLRPSVWIAIMMFSWGVVMTLMGIVHNFAGLATARWFLGVAETGFFPAAAFLLTLFYRRYEVLTRLALFYSCASLSGAFSGLLAFALEKMHGVGGYAGWRWIFIIEGFLPILGSGLALWLVPDSPETCKFLTQEERNFIIYRLQIETGSGHGRVTNNDPIRSHHIIAALKEWKTWVNTLVFWGCSVSNYAFTYTVPTVVEELGYTAAKAQLMVIPVYLCAVIFVIVWAMLSDHYGVRSWFILGGYSLNAIGLIALLAIPHPKFPGATYLFLFFSLAGIFCPQQLLVSWTANNSAPSSKRAISMALLLSIGNLSGVIGSNIFVAKESPRYWAGFGTCLATVVIGSVCVLILRRAYRRENERRDLITEEEIRAKYTDAELLDLGDKSPYFRYTL